MSALLDEQPAPTPDADADLWAEVLADPWIATTRSPALRADMAERRVQGIARYGRALGVDNGRDAKADAYQEALDAVVYAHQRMRQCDAKSMGTAVLIWRRIRNDAAILAERIRSAP